MADCCKELAAEIAALRAAINGLDSKFVKKPELPQLKAEILAGIPLLLGAYATKDQLSGLASKSELTKYLTRADGNTIADAARARLERSFALKSDLPPLERQAREAIEKATGAANKAGSAKSLADKALGGINKVENAIDRIDGKLNEVAGKALKALGASESAISKAGQALSRAGDAAARVASIAGAVAGLLALVGLFMAVFPRLDAHDRQLDSLNQGMSRILSSIQSLKNDLLDFVYELRSRISKLDSRVNDHDFRIYALEFAVKDAVRQATQAFNNASNALQRSISAEKVAAGAAGDAAINAAAIAGITGTVGALGSLAGNALQRANAAQGTAGRALQQASRPGRDGSPGRDGKNGAPGRPGRDGKDGKDGATLSPAAIGALINQQLPSAVRQSLTQQRAFVQQIFVGGESNSMNAADRALLKRIDATTRANLTTSRSNAGLITRVSTVLGGVKTSIDKIIKSQIADKIMLAMTYFTVLHNAYFLSSNLTQTLFSVSSNGINAALRLIGMQSANDEQIDVGKMVSEAFDNTAKTAFGVQTWEGIKTQWKAYSRVYQATANLLFTVQGLFDAARSIQELAAENTGRIGNALKKWGLVGESAYRWMPEQVNHTSAVQRKWEQVAQTGEGLEQAASTIDTVSGSIVNVLDGVTQFNQNKAEFDKAVKEAAPKDRPENEPVKTTTDASKEVSKPPAINPTDLVKPGA